MISFYNHGNSSSWIRFLCLRILVAAACDLIGFFRNLLLKTIGVANSALKAVAGSISCPLSTKCYGMALAVFWTDFSKRGRMLFCNTPRKAPGHLSDVLSTVNTRKLI